MRRVLIFVLLTMACRFAFPAFAQDFPPAQTTSVEKKQKATHIWTNDDLEKLGGGVNVMGSKDTQAAAAASSNKKEEQERCESDGWVAAVTGVLKLQGVPYAKSFWSDRLFGGACSSNIGVAAVAARVDGDYTLEDGRKLHLKTTTVAGLPSAAQLVASVDENHPWIVKWKGEPLVITKVDYIDRRYNFVSEYSISSLMMTNALTGRLLIFDLKTNSAKEIEGGLQFQVENRR